MAATPTTTITARRASGESRRPTRTPSRPPAIEPTASRPAGAQATGADQREHEAGHQVDQAGQHDLQRVGALGIVGAAEPEDGEQNALGRPEVAAVDAAGKDCGHGRRVPVGLAGPGSASGQGPIDARAQGAQGRSRAVGWSG